jgi:hypothetical protein
LPLAAKRAAILSASLVTALGLATLEVLVLHFKALRLAMYKQVKIIS